jgi:hypothetical protein
MAFDLLKGFFGAFSGQYGNAAIAQAEGQHFFVSEAVFNN